MMIWPGFCGGGRGGWTSRSKPSSMQRCAQAWRGGRGGLHPIRRRRSRHLDEVVGGRGEVADPGGAGGVGVGEDGEDGVEVPGRDGEEESAGGLGVGEEDAVGRRDAVGEGGVLLGDREVGLGAAGDAAVFDELAGPRVDDGDRGVVEAGGDPALAAEAGEVAEEAEAGDVGAGPDEARARDRRRRAC